MCHYNGSQENTWRKRAITMTTSKYPMAFFGPGHDATVTIFARDGSVVVTQSGIEMGQGLHTKVSSGHLEWYRDGTGALHQGQ